MKSIACAGPSALRGHRVGRFRLRVSNDVVCGAGQSDRLCCGTGNDDLCGAHGGTWRRVA